MGNSASALPYSIDNQVSSDEYGWNIHEGTKKSDKTPVTVFVGKKPTLIKTPADKSGRNPGMMQLQPALHHFQQCKRVRHPHILEVFATLDTDNPNPDETATSVSSGVDPKTATGDLIIVTEPCVSLQTWLQNNRPTEEQLAWGLQSMVHALHFLHTSANLAHGAVAPTSFYVNRAGDVKLWNFSLATPIGPNLGPDRHFREWEKVLCPPTYRSQERIESRWEAIQNAGIHSMDSYSLGILIGNYYQAAGHRTIPTPLQKATQRLQTPNIRMRPRLQPLLKCPIFTSPYQTLQQRISEVSVQPVEQKVSFWQNLGQQMLSTGPNSGLVDQNMAVYKLLPLVQNTIKTICSNEAMMSQDLYRREVLAVLTPLFFIAENYLTGDKFATEMKPLIGLLFQVKDRGVRGTLLQKMTLLKDNLDAASLNSKVFEPMCSGFSDSSPQLRELTLKSTLGLVPHLTPPNLEKLTRYLIRLQADTEVSIRTNTVIFISKLASHLTPMAREKMILPAFVRALRDTFAPCRLAALQCMPPTFEFFDPQGLAGKLLPSITPHLLDPDANVRKEAFKVSEALLTRLRAESDKMTANEQAQRAAQMAKQNGGATSSAPSSGNAAAAATEDSSKATTSYLAGFASWMASSAQPTTAAATSAAAAPEPMQPQLPPTPVTATTGGNSPTSRPPPAPNSAPLPLSAQKQVQQQYSKMSISSTNQTNNNTMNDGWDDVDDDGGWGDDDDIDVSGGGLVEEDPFASIGMKKTTATTTTPKSSSGLSMGGAKKLVMPTTAKTAATPVSVTKLAVDDDDDIADGWDDF